MIAVVPLLCVCSEFYDKVTSVTTPPPLLDVGLISLCALVTLVIVPQTVFVALVFWIETRLVPHRQESGASLPFPCLMICSIDL